MSRFRRHPYSALVARMNNPLPADLLNGQTICEKSIRDIKMCRFTYTWVIENYTSRVIDKLDRITSPEFVTKDSERMQTWCLEIPPYTEKKKMMSINLKLLKNTEDAELSATANFHVINENVSEIFTDDRRSTMFSYTCGDSYEFKIKKHNEKILKDGIGEHSKDTLKIFCEIDIIYNIIFKPEVAKRKLINDIEQLFTYPKSRCDVTLNIVFSGRELFAHKLILGARSPVFAAMFEHDMMESKEKCIDIPDIDYETAYEMLRYIYSGEVKNIEKFADRLLVAADKYDLEILKKMCANIMKENIEIENVGDLLMIADLYSCDELKRSAFEFISVNSIAVMETESFKTIVKSYPHITTEVLFALAQKIQANKD